LDLRKLRYFVGVAEAGGFRRASEAMFIAQPSLSKHIRELEEELDAQLFERSHVGIRLTPQGRRLLAESRAILERIDNLSLLVAGHDSRLSGSVRIGAPSSIASLLFGPLAERVRAIYPDIHLICSSDGSRLVELLEANEIDTAILTQIDPRELGAGWAADELVREQCFLVGRVGDIDPRHLYCLDEVIRLPLILTPWPNSRRRQMELMSSEAGIRLNVVAEAEAMGAASFARQGTGFAVLPCSSASLMRSLGPLEMAPISDAWSYRLLVRRADRVPSPAAVAVNGFIADLFEEMVAEGVFWPKRPDQPIPIRRAV